jgi:phosphopantetheinyl transferase
MLTPGGKTAILCSERGEAMILGSMELNGITGHEAGQLLLKQLYLEKTGKPLSPISRTDRGKPFFPDGTMHFSIAHTKAHAFCVLSEKNVGIDAEEKDRNVDLRLADKILSPSERLRWEQTQDKRLALLKLWVFKEAAGKLSGEGINGYPNHTDFSLDDPRVTQIGGCIVAVLEGE